MKERELVGDAVEGVDISCDAGFFLWEIACPTLGESFTTTADFIAIACGCHEDFVHRFIHILQTKLVVDAEVITESSQGLPFAKATQEVHSCVEMLRSSTKTLQSSPDDGIFLQDEAAHARLTEQRCGEKSAKTSTNNEDVVGRIDVRGSRTHFSRPDKRGSERGRIDVRH